MEAVKGDEKESTLDSDKKVVDDFINDPENRKRFAQLAFQIQKEFTGWFTIPKIVKTFDTTTTESAKQIEMLMLLKYCVGKVEKSIPYFKIDMTLKVQRELLLEEIADHEGQIKFLKEKLSKLN